MTRVVDTPHTSMCSAHLVSRVSLQHPCRRRASPMLRTYALSGIASRMTDGPVRTITYTLIGVWSEGSDASLLGYHSPHLRVTAVPQHAGCRNAASPATAGVGTPPLWGHISNLTGIVGCSDVPSSAHHIKTVLLSVCCVEYLLPS